MRYIQGMSFGGVELRTPSAKDGAEMAALMRDVYAETDFLNLGEGEFRRTDEEEAACMTRYENAPRDCLIAAWVDGRLAGVVSLSQAGEGVRTRHRGELGIAVRKEFWNRGLGTMLMDAAVQTAESAGYVQLELSAAADNQRALGLYRKMGFREYGCRPRALKRNGEYVDERLMAKRLR